MASPARFEGVACGNGDEKGVGYVAENGIVKEGAFLPPFMIA